MNLYTYCENDPVNNTDTSDNNPLAVAAVPAVAIADVALNAAITAGVIYITYLAVKEVGRYIKEAKSNSKSDPYGRAGQKKKGRENKEKKKGDDANWKGNPNKRPEQPKHHTPGRDHRKY